jgi:lysophospholipase L1-like esterase
VKKLLLFFIIVILFTSFKQRNLTWVAIGDSITYLNDHPNEAGNRITKGYMTMVTEKLRHIRFINQGYNGWTSGGIADSIDKLGLVNADIYSVFLGTNDWWLGRPLGKLRDYQKNTGNTTVYGSFRIIIDKLRSLNNQARILLIIPMQRTDFVYIDDANNNAYGSYKEKNGQTLEQFAGAIDSIGQAEGFDVLDLYHNKRLGIKNLVKFKHLKDPETGLYKNYAYPDYIDIPFHPGVDEYPYPVEAIEMTYDGLHPSDKGYAVITKKLLKIMKKY